MQGGSKTGGPRLAAGIAWRCSMAHPSPCGPVGPVCSAPQHTTKKSFPSVSSPISASASLSALAVSPSLLWAALLRNPATMLASACLRQSRTWLGCTPWRDATTLMVSTSRITSLTTLALNSAVCRLRLAMPRLPEVTEKKELKTLCQKPRPLLAAVILPDDWAGSNSEKFATARETRIRRRKFYFHSCRE